MQILEQAGDGPVGRQGVPGVAALQVAVLVPGLKAAGGVVKLHEPNAPLDQPPRQQALAAEDLGRLLVDAVESPRRLGLPARGRRHRGPASACDRPARTIRSAAPSRLSSSRSVAVQLVEPPEGVELRALAIRAHPVVLQVADRVFQVGDERPLVRGRQERRAVLPAPSISGPGPIAMNPGRF